MDCVGVLHGLSYKTCCLSPPYFLSGIHLFSCSRVHGQVLRTHSLVSSCSQCRSNLCTEKGRHVSVTPVLSHASHLGLQSSCNPKFGLSDRSHWPYVCRPYRCLDRGEEVQSLKSNQPDLVRWFQSFLKTLSSMFLELHFLSLLFFSSVNSASSLPALLLISSSIVFLLLFTILLSSSLNYFEMSPMPLLNFVTIRNIRCILVHTG